MSMLYCPSDNRFYVDLESAPPDAMAVSDALYAELMGRSIEAGPGGLPRLTPTEKRASLLNRLAAKRWEIETGGIRLPNGMHIDTGRADQSAIANAGAVLPFTPLTSISFKAASGFTSITVIEL